MNQRWRNGRDWYRRPEEVIPTRDYEITEVTSDGIVRAFLRLHHYLKTTPPARFRFGLYRHGDLVGVCVFSHPTNDRTVTDAFRCAAIDGVELSRLVLLDNVPGNGESWFVGECLRRLKGLGLTGVVSFSDPVPRWTAEGHLVKPGHAGTVYQALNSRFLGRSTPRTLRLLPDGTVLSERTLQKLRSGEPGTRAIRAALAAWGAECSQTLDTEAVRELVAHYTRPLRHPGNYKYAWALTRGAEKALPQPLPYPKLAPLWWAAERELSEELGGSS